MIILDGKKLSGEINQQLKDEIKGDIDVPGLAVILIGSRRDSIKYIEAKRKVCNEIGIRFILFHLLETCEENMVIHNIVFPLVIWDNTKIINSPNTISRWPNNSSIIGWHYTHKIDNKRQEYK